MTHYKNHVFICTNQKGENKQCCANQNAAEFLDYAKQKAISLGLTKAVQFRISSSGCMGRCADGPVLVIYPSGAWHTYKSKEDIDNILLSLVSEEIKC